MRLRAVVMTAAAMAACLCGCTGSADRGDAVPRRTAYPRITTLDSTYAVADGMPVAFATATGAVASRGRGDGSTAASQWWNIDYPTYGATLYLTFTPVTGSDADAVIDNRAERIALNAGAGTMTVSELTSASGTFGGSIYRSPSSPATPLQFMAVDTARRWVVSGALFFHNASAVSNTDSLAPVVDAVERDLIHALGHLDYARSH